MARKRSKTSLSKAWATRKARYGPSGRKDGGAKKEPKKGQGRSRSKGNSKKSNRYNRNNVFRLYREVRNMFRKSYLDADSILGKLFSASYQESSPLSSIMARSRSRYNENYGRYSQVRYQYRRVGRTRGAGRKGGGIKRF